MPWKLLKAVLKHMQVVDQKHGIWGNDLKQEPSIVFRHLGQTLINVIEWLSLHRCLPFQIGQNITIEDRATLPQRHLTRLPQGPELGPHYHPAQQF